MVRCFITWQKTTLQWGGGGNKKVSAAPITCCELRGNTKYNRKGTMDLDPTNFNEASEIYLGPHPQSNDAGSYGTTALLKADKLEVQTSGYKLVGTRPFVHLRALNSLANTITFDTAGQPGSTGTLKIITDSNEGDGVLSYGGSVGAWNMNNSLYVGGQIYEGTSRVYSPNNPPPTQKLYKYTLNLAGDNSFATTLAIGYSTNPNLNEDNYSSLGIIPACGGMQTGLSTASGTEIIPAAYYDCSTRRLYFMKVGSYQNYPEWSTKSARPDSVRRDTV